MLNIGLYSFALYIMYAAAIVAICCLVFLWLRNGFHPTRAIEIVYPTNDEAERETEKLRASGLIHPFVFWALRISILPLSLLIIMYIFILYIHIADYALSLLSFIISHPIGMLPLLAISIILYGFRTKYPLYYGLSETVVGATAIWFAIAQIQQEANQVQRLLATLGGVYIIVRGLDNIDKQVPDRLKPFWYYVRWRVPK